MIYLQSRYLNSNQTEIFLSFNRYIIFYIYIQNENHTKQQQQQQQTHAHERKEMPRQFTV